MAIIVLMLIVFILGYVAIAMEGTLKINKTASALFLGVVIWVIYIYGVPAVLDLGFSPSWKEFQKGFRIVEFKQKFPDAGVVDQMKYFIVSIDLVDHLGNLSQILFFLLAAMLIVEIVRQHEGFKVITEGIKTTSKIKLLWLLGLITFFLSGVLNNMTTTIVMIVLLRELIEDKKTRWYFTGIIVIASNSGGAFTPIGDVTTIMLWIGGQVTTVDLVVRDFLPSLLSLIVPMAVVSLFVKGHIQKPEREEHKPDSGKKYSTLMLVLGLGGLIFVPVFKEITDLPPYMGMLFSLSVVWIVSEIIHRNDPKDNERRFSVIGALRDVDIASILFYLGILSAVAALESAGHLQIMATYLNKHMHNIYAINSTIGILSSIIDNVPLTAAAMGMYPVMTQAMVHASQDPGFMQNFVQDGAFWELLAYTAGTGGSILIIGSASGIVAMAMEKIDFMWYMKKIGLMALLGFFAGIVVFWLQNEFIF